MSQPLVNRVAKSKLITINLEDFFPKEEIAFFDLKDYLFKGLVLKEKDFRAALKAIDWTIYKNKILLVDCSTDAIIPVWAYMLVAAYATPHAADIFQGNQSAYYQKKYTEALSKLDTEQYRDQLLVIKGCSNHPVPPNAYTEITRLLQPVARSIMYGEPCSTVPVYKKKKKT